MPAPPVPFSFDSETAAAAYDPTAGGAVPVELPAEQQRHGVQWPTPAEMVSDHSAEGAPWLPTARGIPTDPPQGPLWSANHDGPQVPFDAQAAVDQVSGQGISGPAVPVHDGSGHQLAAPNGTPVIGQPFTVNQGGGEVRHLATDQWDATGKRVSPADAPSAPHELYGSQHDTTPRMIPYEVGALFDNVAASNQFSRSPGYWGVQAAMPNLAPRPQGAVAAQPPSDPYVAAAAGIGPAPVLIDYGTDW
ncbi:MAG TPA: hypothetical protein VH307_31270 [Streptosporangiaceae bacterium]|jgi:hypothetical protein|nr:hypothetical protein [Streptosporangiaceae bacterium]